MNSPFKHSAVLFVVVATFGCSTGNERASSRRSADNSAHAREYFETALHDFRAACQSGAAIAGLFPGMTLPATYYMLPTSVEPLIGMGTDALPMLIEFKHSKELTRAKLASACIEIIKAKRVVKGQAHKDPVSGVNIAPYTVVRY